MPITIPTNESETVEFKQSFQSEVIETLVAFANAKGGSVFIGSRYHHGGRSAEQYVQIHTEKQTDCGLLQSGRYYRKIR